ncbi:hypothetical protein NTGBS_190008 [Candidatus Nitrotoga sp. BS]|nr:hypothetical protein NTGBS_190008 [Candidatus Nitrotoga sp. BS]
MLNNQGRFKAHLEGPISGNILLRQAQHRLALDKKFALGIAQSAIAGKLRNSRQILMRGAHEAGDEEGSRALTATVETLFNSLRNRPVACAWKVRSWSKEIRSGLQQKSTWP